ncbi:MAG: EcoRV family type II restriction endonuclease [Endomicrobium sp.]|jgi:hypothetical protein|nr:EcoRV family type II restriction endonuclease [Endomicrobium sp.]
MEKETNFQTSLLKHIDDFRSVLETSNGDWTVKGFIDVFKNIYTISIDTKVISKIIELMLFPALERFAKDNSFIMEFSKEQNHYPDITFITKDKEKIALDLKSSYRTKTGGVSGFTLGAFTGYFRDRKSNKNITYPYDNYTKHYILGVIYSKNIEKIDERKVYNLNNFEKIKSVVKKFDFIVQEKYRIAADRPGSGNTKNISSCNKIADLKNGNGVFSQLGVKIFDDYWINYMTKEMAKTAELSRPPYSNIKQYLNYRNIKNV